MFSKILVVSTHIEMTTAAKQFAQEHNTSIDILTGDLDTALECVKEYPSLSRKQVLVSRGGTAQMLREQYDIPVVEVVVGAYDILRAMCPHRGKKLAVIGAENVVSGARTLADLIGINALNFEATPEHEIERMIDIAVKERCDMIIGDSVAWRVACRRGIPCEMVRSGKEAVGDAIKHALELCNAIDQEREKTQRIGALVEHLEEGILLLNDKREITMMNRRAEHMFKTTRTLWIGKSFDHLPAILSGTRMEQKEENVQYRLLYTKDAVIAAKYIQINKKKPNSEQLVACEDITRIQALEEEIRRTITKRGHVAKHVFSDIMGVSASIRSAIRLAEQYAPVDSTVLLYGESGTGKELFAQAIHNESLRKSGPFIAVNCATFPGSLLESTLFGYESGAFTGAKKDGSKGLFELAHHGTLFLDEIAEMDLPTQAKLLRVLQEREVMRVGGQTIIPIDVRVLASCNQRLLHLVQEGRFRADLYYRLSVLSLELPPLYRRKQDIPLLLKLFMNRYAVKYGKPVVTLAPDVVKKLIDYRWPGNIRQLENVVQRIILTANSDLTADTLNTYLEELPRSEEEQAPQYAPPDGSIKDILRHAVRHTLAEENFNKTNPAKRLGITRATLNRYLENA